MSRPRRTPQERAAARFRISEENFKNAVQAKIKELGTKQGCIASDIGVSDGTLSMNLSNPRRMTVERLRALAGAGVVEEDLVLSLVFDKVERRGIKK